MKTYFITSDTHSFFDELQSALNKAGFDINNSDHIFVLCGDLFDRGYQSSQLYDFILSIPKERRILIRGNHEYLFKEALCKYYPDYYDFSNGTVRSITALSGLHDDQDWLDDQILPSHYMTDFDYEEFQLHKCEQWKSIIESARVQEVAKWFFSEDWGNYWETEHYIFVHSFIPLRYKNREMYDYEYDDSELEREYREDWRNATRREWENASWGCPWSMAGAGFNKTGKMIVCGHWHTADFFNHLKKLNKFYDYRKENPIFESKKYRIIGLDACTAATHKFNVLVLKENEL